MAVLDIFHHWLCDLMTSILICELFDRGVIKCVIIYSNIDLVTFDLYKLTCEFFDGKTGSLTGWPIISILTCELLDGDTGPGRVFRGQEFTELTHGLRGVERGRVQTLVQQVLTVLPVIQNELNTVYSSLNGTNVCIKSWGASLTISEILFLIFHCWILFWITTNVKPLRSRFYFLMIW